MPRISVISGPGYDIGVDYQGGNGRINGVYCNNETGEIIPVTALLTDGTSAHQDFEPGDTVLPVPGNRVQVVANGNEFDFVGLQNISIP